MDKQTLIDEIADRESSEAHKGAVALLKEDKEVFFYHQGRIAGLLWLKKHLDELGAEEDIKQLEEEKESLQYRFDELKADVVQLREDLKALRDDLQSMSAANKLYDQIRSILRDIEYVEYR